MSGSDKRSDPRSVTHSRTEGLTYRDAGVDIDKANEAKRRIKKLARSTFTSGVVSEIGAFAGLYRPDLSRLKKPLLVSSVDGVGTKLKIAFMSGVHHTVGIDIVAHCTNDILVQGAEPIFFLDYIATGTLEPGVVEQIIKGLVDGCKQSECALLGGETAEMPDFYQPGEYDLAGFIVGLADETRMFRPAKVQEGDVLIGLPSSGLHTNGYSLVRKLIFQQEKLSINSYVEDFGKTVGEELLTPHRNYLSLLKDLMTRDHELKAIAHITGGGITENLARVIPENLDAQLIRGTWEVLPVFEFIQRSGKVGLEEMYRTFNMGIGMILVVDRNQSGQIKKCLEEHGESPSLIGELTRGDGKVIYT